MGGGPSPRLRSGAGERANFAKLKIENNESEKSSPPYRKRHATQVVIGTTTNDTAPNRRRYGTSGGPWPTRGAPLARAGLEPGPGETRCDPVRSVVRIGAELGLVVLSGFRNSGEPARAADVLRLGVLQL